VAVAEFGLGAYLVARGVLSREQLGEALQAQVVYGGRLGTNLVELGLLDLDQVADCLAATCGFPLPPKEWVEAPDPRAIELLPRELAERHSVLPLHLDGRSLHVALLDPGDARLVGALTRATNRHLQLYVLPELRLLYALERHLGIERPVRFVNVAKKLERVRRQAAAEPDDRPEEIRLREALGIEALGQGEDLIDESSFADLHQRLVLAREKSAGGPASGAEPVALEAPPAELPRDAASLEALLAAAPDRDDAGRVAVALARLHVPAAALLIVHRGMVMGLFGDGGELERHIGAVLVPIDADSVLARAASSGEAYLGAPPQGALDLRVLRALGRADVREIAVLPIAVRGRVVNLLYVDAGAQPIAETALGALHALTLCVARVYERMILARKQGAGSGVDT
jgi:Type II secretion system (T2SS), protein E, N-terminal domain